MNRCIEVQGQTIYVRIEGQGPNLLFLGGSNFDLGIRASVFDSHLTDHFTVAAADPRGLGKSSAPAGDWTMADYACDALALLDALEWETSAVVGESFGGMTALHLALLAPTRIARMVISVAASGGVGGNSYPIHEFINIEDAYDRARASLTIQDRRFSNLPQEEAAKLIDHRIGFESRFISHADNAAGYPRLLQARATHDCYHQLNDINQDILVLAGQYDDQSPLELSKNLVSSLPNAQLSVHNTGHGLLFNNEMVLPRVLKFLC